MDKLILCIPGETDHLDKIREFVTEFSREAGFPDGTLGEIEFAVDEAATNIVKHAYGEDPDIPEENRIIEIEMRKIDGGIQVVLRDRAKPFNPKNVPLPDMESHLAQKKTHGLGFSR
jgi:serine/threonine-protein kinase RsbW